MHVYVIVCVVENLHASVEIMNVCSNTLNVRTSLVRRLIISNECFTILIAISFLPLLRPCIIREFVRRSTMGHWGKEKGGGISGGGGRDKGVDRHFVAISFTCY